MGFHVIQVIGRWATEDGASTRYWSVEAWCDGPLAVHPALVQDGWTVTHVPSGYRIGDCDSLEEGREIMAALFSCRIDWTRSNAACYQTDEILADIRQAVARGVKKAQRKARAAAGGG